MANKHLTIGPGGRKCSCCFPAPGSKWRAAEYRSAKREEKREAMKQANKDMQDDHDARD